MKLNNTQLVFNSLRQYRKRRGLKQIEVATLLGLNDSSRVSLWERGKCFPTVQTLFRLAAIYHTSADFLYIDMLKAIRAEISDRENNMDTHTRTAGVSFGAIQTAIQDQ
jgi:transcriptional regulator with XRE-family HTH domain